MKFLIATTGIVFEQFADALHHTGGNPLIDLAEHIGDSRIFGTCGFESRVMDSEYFDILQGYHLESGRGLFGEAVDYGDEGIFRKEAHNELPAIVERADLEQPLFDIKEFFADLTLAYENRTFPIVFVGKSGLQELM